MWRCFHVHSNLASMNELEPPIEILIKITKDGRQSDSRAHTIYASWYIEVYTMVKNRKTCEKIDTEHRI